MISMIPFGLLSGFAGEREIRITKLDETGFGFRVVRDYDGAKEWGNGRLRFKICFYDMEKSEYTEVVIKNYKCMPDTDEKSDFYQGYLVFPFSDENAGKYKSAVQKLLGQYSRYIRLKLEEDDSGLAKEMTGYPGMLDEVQCDSLEEQVMFWEKESSGQAYGTAEKESHYELAFSIDRPELYKEYLQKALPDFVRDYGDGVRKILPDFSFEAEKMKRLYIGNQFCPQLFPKEKILFEMLDKAAGEEAKVTLALSYVREEMLEKTAKLLRKLDSWCLQKGQMLEVVVNDWGMVSMVKKGTMNLVPCLGILLNKRKKDPRISYKAGNKSLFKKNGLNADFYRDFLKEKFGILRYEWESCGYEIAFPEGKNSLHLPFYQTNTSSFCPLYAACKTGERGRQKLVKDCPEYCRKYVFLYPEHLHMVGRFNSLFGIDREGMERIKSEFVDRVVVSLL